MNKKIENKEKKQINIFLINYFNLISLIIIVFIFLIIFIFFIKPEYENVKKDTQTVISEIEKEKDLLIAYQTKLDQKIKIFNDLDKSYIDLINKILPNEEENEKDIFIQIENLANNQGLLLKSINVSKKQENNNNRFFVQEKDKEEEKIDEEENFLNQVNKLEISFELEGFTYEKLKFFLASIENNIRIIDIQRISFDEIAGIASFKAIIYFEKIKS